MPYIAWVSFIDFQEVLVCVLEKVIFSICVLSALSTKVLDRLAFFVGCLFCSIVNHKTSVTSRDVSIYHCLVLFQPYLYFYIG